MVQSWPCCVVRSALICLAAGAPPTIWAPGVAAAAATVVEEEAIATLPFGKVSGNLLQASKEFLGIPFAPQPVRFMPPQSWTALFPQGQLQAKQYSAQCQQVVLPGLPKAAHGAMMLLPQSEDCLNLNIYTPRGEPPEEGWPVLQWIHGGALVQGTASNPTYNASVLAAEKKVVVVAANYRMGALGFATVLDGGRPLANNGFRDQQEAMRWVRAHIGSFGGNPAQLTIFGESAGGESVSVHVLSPSSAGLFDGAISESGDTTQCMSLEAGLKKTAAVAKQLGCDGDAEAGGMDLACLRNIPAERFTSGVSMWTAMSTFMAVVDGDVLPKPPLQLARDGDFNRVPFVLGVTQREGDGLGIYPPAMPTIPATAGDVECALRETFGTDDARTVMELLPVNDAPGIDNRPVLSTILGDLMMACPNRRIGLDMAKHGHAPWFYVFQRHTTQPCSYEDTVGFDVMPMPSAGHGIDIPYAFGSLEWLATNPKTVGPDTNTTCDLPPVDRALERKVMELWSNFAKTGTMPDPAWPRFQSPEETSLKIGITTANHLDTEEGHFRGQCDALDAMGLTGVSFLPLVSAVVPCQQKRQSHGVEIKRALVGDQQDAERLEPEGVASLPPIIFISVTVTGALCAFLGMFVSATRLGRTLLQTFSLEAQGDHYSSLLGGSAV